MFKLSFILISQKLFNSSNVICNYMNVYNNYNIVNCELMGPHTNLFGVAHYLFKKKNKNKKV